MEIKSLFSEDIVELLDDDAVFDEKIHHPTSIRFLLREVYNKYLYMRENNIVFDDNIMRKIIIMSTIYYSYLKSSEVSDNIMPTNEFRIKVDDRISNMKRIDDIDSFDKYYKDIKAVIKESSFFSLDEQYMNFEGDDLAYQLNGVCVITPSQTICRYNSVDEDGRYGLGYHEDNFKGILRSVYGRDFKDNFSGQDIIIRFVNSSFRKDQYRAMTIEIPLTINSSQLYALIKFNNELKKLSGLNSELYIDLCVAKSDKTEYCSSSKIKNLDKILPNLIIDDYVDYQSKEEFFVGQNNFESSFVKAKHFGVKH